MLIALVHWDKDLMSGDTFLLLLMLGWLVMMVRCLYVGIFPAVCGRGMTVLPRAAQRGGLVNTGVIPDSSFE